MASVGIPNVIATRSYFIQEINSEQYKFLNIDYIKCKLVIKVRKLWKSKFSSNFFKLNHCGT